MTTRLKASDVTKLNRIITVMFLQAPHDKAIPKFRIYNVTLPDVIFYKINDIKIVLDWRLKARQGGWRHLRYWIISNSWKFKLLKTLNLFVFWLLPQQKYLFQLSRNNILTVYFLKSFAVTDRSELGGLQAPGLI